METIKNRESMFNKIIGLIEKARNNVAIKINQEMVLLYWNIGRIIKKEIMKSKRAEYGKQILHALSRELTKQYGKGFSEQNLWYMIQFYTEHPILQSMIGEFKDLSWTHIIIVFNTTAQ